MVNLKLLYPLKGGKYPITQTFREHVQRAIDNGWCYQPGTGCTNYYYGGIDYGCPKGTKVIASMSHQCKVVQDNTGYGWHVKGIAKDVTIVYAHLSAISVKNGETVEVGDLIGLSGGIPGEPGAGFSSGAHLHFEVRVNGIPIDPQPFLLDTIPNPTTPLPAYKFKYGDKVRLADGFDYVNIRNAPGVHGYDLGDFKPGDTATVIGMDATGEWVLVFDQWGVQLWLNAGYLTLAK